MISQIPFVAKAIAAFLTAGAGALTTALIDNTVTTSEWVTVAVTAIIAGLSVYGVRNRQDFADV